MSLFELAANEESHRLNKFLKLEARQLKIHAPRGFQLRERRRRLTVLWTFFFSRPRAHIRFAPRAALCLCPYLRETSRTAQHTPICDPRTSSAMRAALSGDDRTVLIILLSVPSLCILCGTRGIQNARKMLQAYQTHSLCWVTRNFVSNLQEEI
jgi:hypothetical protein